MEFSFAVLTFALGVTTTLLLVRCAGRDTNWVQVFVISLLLITYCACFVNTVLGNVEKCPTLPKAVFDSYPALITCAFAFVRILVSEVLSILMCLWPVFLVITIVVAIAVCFSVIDVSSMRASITNLWGCCCARRKTATGLPQLPFPVNQSEPFNERPGYTGSPARVRDDVIQQLLTPERSKVRPDATTGILKVMKSGGVTAV